MSLSLGNNVFASSAVRRPAGRGSTGALVVFFSFFALFGGFMTWLVLVRPTLSILAARSWTPTPCTIISSQVGAHHGGKGGPTYSVDVVYTYQVHGQPYQATRYDFMGGSSSGYDGKAAVVRQLPPESTTTGYVNPHNPAEAVLVRGFTATILFGLIPLLFFAIGAGGLVWCIRSRRQARVAAAAAAPWLQRPDWAAGRITSSSRSTMIFLWIFALVWNAISAPVVFLLPHEITHRHNYPALLGFLFPLVGIGLLVAAVWATLRWWKFGDSVFELATLPGIIGGPLEGTIRLRTVLRPDAGFKLRLCNIRSVTEGSGKNRSTREPILSQQEHQVPAGSGDAIPVAFAVPADGVDTDTADPSNRVLWRLEASASVPGVDYAAAFEVPVFKIVQTAVQLAEAARLRARDQAALAQYQPPANSRIRVETSLRSGKEFHFPAARNPGAACSLTGFTLIWTGSIAVQLWLKAPLLFPIVCGLIELLLLFFVIQLWFSTSHLVVDHNSLVMTNGLLGLGRTRTIPASDITGITTTIGMTAGTTVYRDLQILCGTGRKLTVARAIRDPRQAEWLVAELARALGRPGSTTTTFGP